MGVPKFFRYISERYPNLSELVGTKELPQFDNMYLDMNGIIHVCSHPDDTNVHFRISEEQIFRDVFHYIDTLFRLIQPQKLFFMAVDGVAPRAKMNQQRGRRFRSAREALDLIEKAKKKGEKLPEESRFDSNCITPGTEFMVRLQKAMKYFIKRKMSSDSSWQKCRFILSGHETPGEGEHKIMEYIRYLKSQPDYDPNTRHCLYGLDADLIMLGLCTHELRFSLLREEVKFGKKAKRAQSVDETRFYLLHLGLLREYLQLEFFSIKNNLNFEYDIEKIIDDWILLCFMVGNDFIPHLPNLHIGSNALPTLYNTYMAVLPDLNGYINESGVLNLERLEKFMHKLGEVDRDLFKQHYADLRNLESKYDNDETFNIDFDEIVPANKNNGLEDLITNTELEFGSSSSEDDGSSSCEDLDIKLLTEEIEKNRDLSEDELFEMEFQQHKRDYYISKLRYPEVTKEVLAEQTECYIIALQWNLAYYYRGVCSWGWFYPHHYAPYISDIQSFKHLQIKLDMGRPFLPFQQLLAVLPAASKDLLPKAYHNLMLSSDSKLIDYYPDTFETDLNGKKQDWEAVVLIPFIDEKKLLDAMLECDGNLTDWERERNIHGPMLQYDYCPSDQGPLTEPSYGQPEVHHVFCTEKLIYRDEVQVSEENLVLGPCDGALSDYYFPGFPTMRHLQHSAILKAGRIKVFDQPSRNENMVIKIDEPSLDVDLNTLASMFMKKIVYVGWPHLHEAKVVAVSDKTAKIDKHGVTNYDSNSQEFSLHVKQIIDHHFFRMGIDLEEVSQLIHVVTLSNREYITTNEGKLTLTKNWSQFPLACPVKTVVKDIGVHLPFMEEFKNVEDVFTKDTTIFMLNNLYYGCQGTVIDPVLRNGRLKISMTAHPQPDFTKARESNLEEGQTYTNSYNASSSIGLNNKVFARITGTVLVVPGEKRFPISDRIQKINVGLQLKFPKHSEELAGYTKSSRNQWLYSQKATASVEAYMEKYPKLFEALNQKIGNNDAILFESEIFDKGQESDSEETSSLNKLAKWLKEQPHNKAVRRCYGTDSLEKNTVEAIMSAVEELKSQPVRVIKLQVKPHLLYKPNLNDISVSPDPKATFFIFDRVVIAREGYSVPFGARGTIIAVATVIDSNPVRQENIGAVEYFYEVLFDEPFEGGFSIDGIAEQRVFKVRQSVLINISYGLGLNRENPKPQPIANYWQTHTNVDTNRSINGVQYNMQENMQIEQMSRNFPPIGSSNRKRGEHEQTQQQQKYIQIQKPVGIRNNNHNTQKQRFEMNTVQKQTEINTKSTVAPNGRKDVMKNNSQLQQKQQHTLQKIVQKRQQQQQPVQSLKTQQQPKHIQQKNNNNQNRKSQPREKQPFKVAANFLENQMMQMSLANQSLQQQQFNADAANFHERQLNESNQAEKMDNMAVTVARNDDKTTDSSDALKKLLGISNTLKDGHQPITSAADAPFDCLNQNIVKGDPQQVLLDNLFNQKDNGFRQISPQALPKPPSNWTGQLFKNKEAGKPKSPTTSALNPLQQFQQSNPHLFQNHHHQQPQNHHQQPQNHQQQQPLQIHHNRHFDPQNVLQQQHQPKGKPPQYFPYQYHHMPPQFAQPHNFQPPMPSHSHHHHPHAHPHPHHHHHHMQPFIPFHAQEPPHLFNSVQGRNTALYYNTNMGNVSKFNNLPQHNPPPFAYPNPEPRQPLPVSSGQETERNVKLQSPNGPQNLSNNSKYLPGHGAFIPLQAIRKSAKAKAIAGNVSSQNEISAEKKTKSIVKENKSEGKKAPIAPNQVRQGIKTEKINDTKIRDEKKPDINNLDNKLKASSKEALIVSEPLTNRPKRIAAKFDMAPV